MTSNILSVEQLEEIIDYLNSPNSADDIETYDGSYEVVHKAAQLFNDNFPRQVGVNDLDMFYYLSSIVGDEAKKKRVWNSSLDENDKQALVQLIDEVGAKHKSGFYKNYDGNKTMFGMFNKPIGTFNKANGVSRDDATKLVRLFADLSTNLKDSQKLEHVDNLFKDGIYGIGTASASQILHCIDPFVFPVINGHQGRDSIYTILDVEIPKNRTQLLKLSRYIEYCRAIQVYKAKQGLNFKNYRVFDLAEFKLPQIYRKGTLPHPSASATKEQIAFSYFNLLHDQTTVQEIEELVNTPNIFEILKIGDYEIRHSNMLAWLLNPAGNHGLDNKILKAFMRLVAEDLPGENKDVLNDLNDNELDSFMVYREHKHLDIFIVSDSCECGILVENKLFTGEHDNQLDNYKKKIGTQYPDYKLFYVYLTPSGLESSDPDNWKSLSYQKLIEAIDNVISEQEDEVNSDVALLLKHYSNIVHSKLLGDDALKTLCRDFYMTHRLVLDKVYEYVYKYDDVVRDIITGWLDVNSENYNLISPIVNNQIIGFDYLDRETQSDDDKALAENMLFQIIVDESSICFNVKNNDNSIKKIDNLEFVTSDLYKFDEEEVNVLLTEALKVMLNYPSLMNK